MGNYLFSVWRVVSPPSSTSLRPDWQNSRKIGIVLLHRKKECGKPDTLVKIGKRIAISLSSRKKKKMDNVLSHKRVHRPFLSLQSNEEVPKSGNFFYSFLVFVGKKRGGGYVVKPEGRREEDNCSWAFFVSHPLGRQGEGKDEWISLSLQREGSRKMGGDSGGGAKK